MKTTKYKDLTINIYNYIFDEIQSCIKINSKNENGGILLGLHNLDNEEYFINNLTFPNSDDEMGKFFFVRKKTEHQKHIKKLWKESNGVLNYIGEWHTHPEKIPSPSSVDLNTWKEISKNKNLSFPFKVNIIVGNDDFYYICIMKKGVKIYEETKKF